MAKFLFQTFVKVIPEMNFICFTEERKCRILKSQRRSTHRIHLVNGGTNMNRTTVNMMESNHMVNGIKSKVIALPVLFIIGLFQVASALT